MNVYKYKYIYIHVGRGVTQTITAGRWISFQHKIFKDKTVYVRVVEVTGDEKVWNIYMLYMQCIDIHAR
jgi:hypothetical protein